MENNKKRSVIAIALITAICLAGDSMLYIVLPTHWKEVGLTSLVQVGILLSINRFVRLPLNPIIGFIYTKVNLRYGILLAVFLAGITTFGYGLASDFKTWVILRSIWGLAWSLFKLGAFLLILQLSTDDNRGNFIGTYNGLYRLGSLFGMLVGGFLADLFGIKVICFVLGIIAFASIPVLLAYVPNLEGKNQSKPSLKQSLQLFQNKSLVWILATAFLTIMVLEGMFTATLSHIIDIQLTSEPEVFGLIIGAATMAGVIQGIRWGVVPFLSPWIGGILDRVTYKKNVLSLFLGLASVLLVMITFNIPIMFWLPLLLFHLLVASVLTTIVDSMVSDMATKLTNKVFIMTAYTIIADLGAALGPILGYTLEGIIGLTNTFWICAAVCVLLTIKWILPAKKTARGRYVNVTEHY